jgi:hypothetical protein
MHRVKARCKEGKSMTRKNKTPWKSANMFKKRKSSDTVGHPVHVYKKRGRFYKYLTFTHKPVVGNESNYEKLKYNIDPSDTSDCYVSKKYAVTRQDTFKDPDKNTVFTKRIKQL